MELGLRGRFFLVSVTVFIFVGVASSAYLDRELQSWVEGQLVDDLQGRADVCKTALSLAPTADDVDAFDALADTLGESTQLRVTLVSTSGAVIGDSALSTQQLNSLGSLSQREEILEALKSGRGSARRDSLSLGVDTLFVAVPYEHPLKPGVLRLATPFSTVVDRFNHVRLLIGIAGGLGLLLAIIMSFLTSHLLSRRLRKLLSRARAIADAQGEATQRAVNAEELTVLHKSVDRLGEALEDIVATLAQERDRFAAVLDGMKEAVIAVDDDQRVTLVNPAALEFLELNEIELGTPLKSVITSEEILDAFSTAMGGRGTEVDILARDGTRHVLCRAAPGGSAAGCIMVLHDVTRLKRLERMRRDFVANVSHELRTPVSVIRLNAEALADGALTDPNTGPRFVGAMVRHAERLSDIISDLLDISRIESGLYEMEPNLVDLNDSANRAYDSVEQLATEKGIAVSVDIPQNLMVGADKRALEHVLINLLQNAVRYTQESGRIEVNAEITDGQVRIHVRDNGPGIPEKYHHRVFERFFRVDKGRSKHMGGTGLGLSIVKHLIANMGGKVGVTDNQPAGAHFWFTLPTEIVRTRDASEEIFGEDGAA